MNKEGQILHFCPFIYFWVLQHNYFVLQNTSAEFFHNYNKTKDFNRIVELKKENSTQLISLLFLVHL